MNNRLVATHSCLEEFEAIFQRISWILISHYEVKILIQLKIKLTCKAKLNLKQVRTAKPILGRDSGDCLERGYIGRDDYFDSQRAPSQHSISADFNIYVLYCVFPRQFSLFYL